MFCNPAFAPRDGFPARGLRSALTALSLVAACATCDASTALAPPELRAVAIAWDGDTVLVAGSSRPAAFMVSVDGMPHPAARLRLVSSDTGIISVGPDRVTLTAHRLGAATITATLLDATLPSPPPFLATTLVVSPAMLRLGAPPDTLRSLGDTVRLPVSATDASGAEIPGATAEWSSSDTLVATVSPDGLVTARTNGSAEIRARLGSITVSATVVTRQRPASVRFVPGSLLLDALGADSALAATVLDARGSELGDLAPPLTWSSGNPAVATVADGRVTALANGTAWARVVAGTLRDSIMVDVRQRAARVVVETPSPVSMQSIGETIVMRARAYDRRDNEVQIAAPTWRSLNPLVVHVEGPTGIATALGAGAATLSAELDGASASAPVTVADVPARIVLTPDVATLTSVGDTLQLAWVVQNARGVAIEGIAVTLRSTDTTIAAALDGGRARGAGTGTARIIASTPTGIADTSLVTVMNAVAHVAIAAEIATLASVGDTVIPAASIRNERGAELPRTAAAWTSDDPGVARVSAGGVVIAAGPGETLVRAASPYYPDRRDSLAVVVTDAPATVVLERATDLVTAVGASRTYAVEVRNGRGSLLAVTPEWRTLDATVARVSTTGLVTTAGIGTARIVAAAGTAADTLVLTVRDEVVHVEVSPATATLTSLGDVLYPSATARNALGTVVAAPSLAWTSADTTVARLLSDGGVLAVGTGSTRIVVSSNSLADTMLLAVTNLPVLIDIAGTTDTIAAVGDSVMLSVVARNARGDSLSTASLAWTIDDPVVARVGSTGTVTARAVGGTWVRAGGGTAKDSIWIVVTNEPAGIVMTLAATGAHAVTDTMTASGQALDYDAAATNRIGLLIPDAAITWRLTDPGVASVSPGGVVTAMGTGSAWVIAQAGTVADSLRLVVIDARRVYVDNAIVVAPRFGTLARPYATIQDGVNAASVDDTVIVFRGNSYSESVTLGRRVTLLGDSAAFVAGGRDPLLLPLLRHDLGAAGITMATPGASFSIRYLGIQHSVDGEAIAARDADNLVLGDIYVNPVPGFRTGRGILVEGAAGTVSIARSRVDSVYAFGIRIRDAANAQLQNVTVRGVAARSGYIGAGIEIVGGSGVVSGASVRRTAGPQVHLSRTVGASLLASTLVGEQQLVRLDSVRGTTTIRGNTFDMRLQGGETSPVRGSGLPDPSAVEILGSAGVLVDANVFTDVGGQSSLMDGVRLADVRVGASGASYGALLTANRFRGGRTAVRSARSSWTMNDSRVDSTSVGIVLTEADSVTLARDTIAMSRVAGVQSTGAATRVAMVSSVVTGAQRAIVVSGARDVLLRNNVITGTAFTGFAQPALGALDVGATTAEVVGNSISGIRGWSGLVLRDGTARADSNYISRNLAGIRLGSTSVPTLAGNSIFDNDTLSAASPRAAVGLRNEGVPRTIGRNWWGAPEGPQSDALLAPAARGDSIVGGATSDTLMAPIAAHRGGSAADVATLRKVAGDGQVGAIGMPAPVLLSARAVDAAGRPLAGVAITFTVPLVNGSFTGGVRSGNVNTVTLVTGAGGLAGAEYTPATSGPATIMAFFDNKSNITFTVTAP